MKVPPLELKSSSLGTEKFLPNFLVAGYLAEKQEVTVWRDAGR